MLEHILSAIVVLHSQCQDYLRECSQRGRTARAAEDGKCTKVSTLAEGAAPASTLRHVDYHAIPGLPAAPLASLTDFSISKGCGCATLGIRAGVRAPALQPAPPCNDWRVGEGW